MAFGDFRMADISKFDYGSYLLTTFTVIFTAMILMNLLIGVISESVGKIFDNRVRSDYYQLCNVLLVAETHMFWNSFSKVVPPQHLMFFGVAEDEDAGMEDEGRVAKISNKFKSIKKKHLKMQTVDDLMAIELAYMERRLDLMDQNFTNKLEGAN